MLLFLLRMKKPDKRGLKLPLCIYAERKEIMFNWPLDDRTRYLAIFNHVWKRQSHFSTAAFTLSFKGLTKIWDLARDLLPLSPSPQNLHFSWLFDFRGEDKTNHFTAFKTLLPFQYHGRIGRSRWPRKSKSCRCERFGAHLHPATRGKSYWLPRLDSE